MELPREGGEIVTDLPAVRRGLVVAHDALVDVLEAEEGSGIHALTLSDFSELEAIAVYLRELYSKLPKEGEGPAARH